VVQVLGRRTAVLARPRVSGEDGTPGEGGLGPVRDPDEVPQPEHRWGFDLVALGAEDHPVGDDDLRLVLQDEHHRPPGSHHCQRLVGRVEYERSSHAGPAASIASGLRNPVQVLESAKSQGCNPAEGGGWIVSEGSGRLKERTRGRAGRPAARLGPPPPSLLSPGSREAPIDGTFRHAVNREGSGPVKGSATAVSGRKEPGGILLRTPR